MAIRNFRVGGFVTDTPTDIKLMSCRPSTNNNYMTFEYPVGTDYQVTAGKILYITRVLLTGISANDTFVFGYGDTGVADGAAAPTNFVQLTQEIGVKWPAAATYVVSEVEVWVPIPAGKFPCVREINGAGIFNITAMGFEV